MISPSYQSAAEPQLRGPGLIPYVISLVVGVPTLLMMAYFVHDGLFPALTLTLAALSALGCVLAVAGMRSSPRRFRTASLVLTLIPGMATIAGFGVLIAVLVAFVTAAGGGR